MALSWAAPFWNGGRAISGYNVYKGTAQGAPTTRVNPNPLTPSTLSLTVTGLARGTKYYFVVKAINGVGTSLPSNETAAVAH